MITDYANYIGGRRVPAREGRTLDVTNPANGQVWARIPQSDAGDVAAAVDAAAEAFPSWSRLDAKQRSAHLRALAEVTRAHIPELADLETFDTGRVIKETLYGHLPTCVEILHFFAGAADKLHGDTVNVGTASFNFTRREPLGVVGLVLPWNSPMSLITAKAAAALAAGNTVVVKPAEQACCSILRWTELFEEAGLPPGVINVVTGLGEVAGDALVRHPKVARISFTGSTETARILMAAAAGSLKQLHFELGGKSPNIVFADADLDAATLGVTRSGIFTANAGQSCIAGSRILVQRPIFDEMVERITSVAEKLVIGDPRDEVTDIGAIISPEQLARVRSYIDIGRDDDRLELLFGGRTTPELFGPDEEFAGGWFVEPTLFRAAGNESRLASEEIFGPVGLIVPFDDDEDALAIANGTDYGLAAGVWTSNLRRAHRLIRDLDAGNVWVNAFPRIHFALPFGGMKDSGFGKDSGWESVLENTRIKTAWIDLL
ncbi:MAG: Betaine-aldehyde dehydrogenase [Mycobacterium sp.]|nr:Betaine-aldehyde dehydrogenase [Mycobacterium sp.]